MFGIGGGELIFMARTMGKAMAQLKNATNDIKNEIQKGADANGLNQNILTDLTKDINSEIDNAKANLLSNSNPLKSVSDNFTSDINQINNTIAEDKSSSVTSNTVTNPIESTPYKSNNETETILHPEESEAYVGPIKRKK
jgi:sec-independent protein translocase protein TatA